MMLLFLAAVLAFAEEEKPPEYPLLESVFSEGLPEESRGGTLEEKVARMSPDQRVAARGKLFEAEGRAKTPAELKEIAKGYQLLDDPEALQGAALKLQQQEPDSSDGYTFSAGALHRNGDFEGAASEARKALERNPNDKAAFAVLKLSESRVPASGGPPSVNGVGERPSPAVTATGGGSRGGGSDRVHDPGAALRRIGGSAAPPPGAWKKASLDASSYWTEQGVQSIERARAADGVAGKAYHYGKALGQSGMAELAALVRGEPQTVRNAAIGATAGAAIGAAAYIGPAAVAGTAWRAYNAYDSAASVGAAVASPSVATVGSAALNVAGGPIMKVADKAYDAAKGALKVADATEGTARRIIAGGGAKVENLTHHEIDRIQRFADKYNTDVTVVGSRAGGTAHAYSDLDYLVGGNRSLREKAFNELPRGLGGGRIKFGVETGIDVINANAKPLVPSKPHLIIKPRNVDR